MHPHSPRTHPDATPHGWNNAGHQSPRTGVPIKVVSQRIGHADPAVTMQVYALQGDDATAAETTATAIFGDG